ncbi:hypothetical protein ACS0TY_016900 [Phlomoides rotata]
MDPLGNANGHDGDRGKDVRGRRSWSKVEEDALIHCLIDIVNDGWKVENGFKVGFHIELEKGMKKMLPGTGNIANPQINSKIHADPHLKSIRFKSCPYYSQWLEIFGKDSATSENEVDPVDLINDLL